VLLRQLGEQTSDLFQRKANPRARVRVDREVDAGRGGGGVGDPVRDRCLHRDVLEVRCASVEEQGLLAIIHRHFAE